MSRHISNDIWLNPTSKQLEVIKQEAKLRTIAGHPTDSDWRLIAVAIPRLVATIRKMRGLCFHCGRKSTHSKTCSRRPAASGKGKESK